LIAGPSRPEPQPATEAAWLVNGFEETKLLALTGDHPANPTMNLSSRVVLGSRQKKIEVHGPFPEIEDELICPHRDFWRR
jgi:hypothetical protein